ncbi:MAG: choice-of-anchor L domain-containing protein [Bacteroidales bacterium]|nr:choice-of-anchor L domain-containing protein [Bacteroidales bacterium]MCF8455223.1 choice-of-anchor L domain-containing protein [Bacteroidales bacterium]
MKHTLTLFTFCILVSYNVIAQPIAVNTSLATDTMLIKELLDNPYTDIFNIQFSGDPISYGIFTKENSNFDLPRGIILTNGKAINAVGPNNSTGIFYNNNSPDNLLLNGLLFQSTHDASVLEFDFVSCDNFYLLKLVFGSEEYLESVNSNYNDGCGIFVSGPNPNSSPYVNQNFAVIPQTTLPICINNVNNTTNSDYFFFNGDGYVSNNEALQYDGYTIPITCKIPIVPGEVYHVAVVIGDATDSNVDSGILFCADQSTLHISEYSVSLESPYGFANQLFEGYPAHLHFEKTDSAILNNNFVVNLEVLTNAGNANPGVDYQALPGSIVIPAGSMTFDYPLTIYADGVSEPNEWLSVNFSDTCPSGGPIIQAIIQDAFMFDAGIAQETYSNCISNTVTLHTFANAADSMLTYLWSDGSTADSLIVSGVSIFLSTYSVTISHVDGFSMVDYVSDELFSGQVNTSIAIQKSCIDTTGIFAVMATDGSPPYLFQWSTSATTAILNPVFAGDYWLTVFDNSGCLTVDSVVNFNPIPLSMGLEYSNAGCIPSVAIATATGGTPPYSYEWIPGLQTDNNKVITQDGIYSISIEDASGCVVSDSFFIVQDTSLSLQIDYEIGLGCTPFSGSINLTIVNGTSPYSFKWSNFMTTEDIENLWPYNYSVSVTDANYCFWSQIPITIDPLTNLSYSFNYSSVTNCATMNNGFVEIFIQSHYGQVNYNWSNGSILASIDDLSPGTYYFTISDLCSVILDSVIIEPPALLSIAIIPDDDCLAGTWDLELNIDNGTPPFTYLWNTGSTDAQIDSVSGGDYFVTVIDDYGCMATASLIGYSLIPLEINLNYSTAGCIPSVANVQASGGTPPYGVFWSTNTYGAQTLIQQAGEYWVKVQDLTGCSIIDTFNIVADTSSFLEISENIILDPCSTTPGTIDISIVNGAAPFTYLWSNWKTTEDVDSLAPGSYSLSITDANYCYSVYEFNIPVSPVTTLSYTLSHTLATDCIGLNNGSAVATAFSLVSPVNYQWSNGSTDSLIQNLSPGIFHVTISDQCEEFVDFVNIVYQNPLALSLASTNTHCNDSVGTVSVSVNPPSLVDSMFLQNTSGGEFYFPDSSGIFYSLPSGNFLFTLVDTFGCANSDSVFVGIEILSSFNLNVTHANCNDSTGSVQVFVNPVELLDTMYLQNNLSGGIFYPDSTGIFHFLPSGSYVFTIVDMYGCTATDSVFVGVVFPTSFSLDVTDALCSDSTGTVQILLNTYEFLDSMYLQSNLTGGLFYPDASGLFKWLPQDDYTFTLVDTFGCSVTYPLQIEYFPNLLSATIDTAYCAGYPVTGNATVLVTGNSMPGSLYDIQFPVFNHEILMGGTLITPNLIDDYYWGPFPIGFDFSFFGNVVTQFYVGSNGWVSFSPLSSSTYDPWITMPIPNPDPSRPRNAIFALYRDWYPGTGGNGSIKYYVTGTAPFRKLVVNYVDVPLFSCTNSLGTFQVVLYETSDIVDVNIIDGPSCPSWNSGNGVLGIQNADGTVAYPVQGYNNTNFQLSNYSVRYNPQKPLWYDPIGTFIGEGDAVNFGTYLPGTYTCEAYTGCGLETVEIDVPFFYDFTLDLGPDQLLCPYETVLLQLPPTISGDWSTGLTDTALWVSQPGEYSVQVSLANGYCNWSDTVSINYEVFDYFPGLDTMICPGDTIVVEFDTAFSYQWTNGSNTNWLSISGPSTFQVTVSNANCDLEDTVELSPGFYPLPVTVLPDDTTKCPGLSLLLDGGNEPSYSYTWNNGFLTDTAIIDTLGLYLVTITDILGCQIVDAVWVSEEAPVNSSFQFFEAFNHVNFINQSQNAYYYLWDFGDGSPISNEANPEHDYPVLNQNMWYTATLVSANQCGSDTSTMQIFTFDIEEMDGESPIQIYPNPNKGNFFLSGNIESKDDLKVSIFNSTGQEVYRKEISSKEGKLSEEIELGKVAPGIYFLMVQQQENKWVWKMVVE